MKSIDRNFILSTSLTTLSQNVLWCILSTVCVCNYLCFISVDSMKSYDKQYAIIRPDDMIGTIGDLIYLAYFRSKCDNPDELTNLRSVRTYYFMIAYCVISVFGIISGALLYASTMKIYSSTVRRWMYFYPWIISTGVTIFVDLFASTYYLLDISKMATITDYCKFVGLKGFVTPATEANTFFLKYVTIAPATVMFLLFSRGICLFLVNLYQLGKMINVVCSDSKPEQRGCPTMEQRDRSKTEQRSRSRTKRRVYSKKTADESAECENSGYIPWSDVPQMAFPVNLVEPYADVSCYHQYEYAIPDWDYYSSASMPDYPVPYDLLPTSHFQYPSHTTDRMVNMPTLTVNAVDRTNATRSRNFDQQNVVKIPRISTRCCVPNCVIHEALART